MHIISKILIGLIAAVHCYILVLEIFLWESRGPVVFNNFPAEMFAQTKVMAANQGLYNGFLAAGLLWALFFIKDMAWKKNVALFFLSCIAIAGIFGMVTVSNTPLFAQAIPAIFAILSVLFLKQKTRA